MTTGHEHKEEKVTMSDLKASIFSSSMDAAGYIIQEWTELTREKALPAELQYTIRFEMLIFFLLMMERYAANAGCIDTRDAFKDEIIVKVLERLITPTFKNSEVQNDPDAKASHNRMVNEAFEHFHEAASSYNGITKLRDNRPDFRGERTILGRLSFRIATHTKQTSNPMFMMFIIQAAASSLPYSNLKSQVEQVCESLAKP